MRERGRREGRRKRKEGRERRYEKGGDEEKSTQEIKIRKLKEVNTTQTN